MVAAVLTVVVIIGIQIVAEVHRHRLGLTVEEEFLFLQNGLIHNRFLFYLS